MDRSVRKIEHIKHALTTNQFGGNGFDDVSFLPNSLPNTSFHHVSLQTEMGKFRLSSPMLINAMTGGAKQTTEINRKLAVIAREKGLAMAVGSQMAALKDPSVSESYRVVRVENPRGILFANVGAEATVDQAKAAVDMLEADGLQIHLNVMQELLMPEGDRDFRGYVERIQSISEQVDVPVMVKEVGFGMARNTVLELIQAGVSLIDVGGRGGTNFAKVENLRRASPLTMFEEWGLTTVESLLEASCVQTSDVAYVATGGIRHGLDVAKALAMGASAAGIAGAMLRCVQSQSLDDCLRVVDGWQHQLRVAMTALGANRIADLREQSLFITGATAERARLRGIALEEWAKRGK